MFMFSLKNLARKGLKVSYLLEFAPRRVITFYSSRLPHEEKSVSNEMCAWAVPISDLIDKSTLTQISENMYLPGFC